jgi:hypothetical protein
MCPEHEWKIIVTATKHCRLLRAACDSPSGQNRWDASDLPKDDGCQRLERVHLCGEPWFSNPGGQLYEPPDIITCYLRRTEITDCETTTYTEP